MNDICFFKRRRKKLFNNRFFSPSVSDDTEYFFDMLSLTDKIDFDIELFCFIECFLENDKIVFLFKNE